MQRYEKYKDSGVKWIGKIPGHWEVCSLKRCVSKVGSGSTPTGGANVYVPEGINFIRSQNVYFEGMKMEDVAHINPEIDEKMKGTRVQAGDVLLNITGGSIGRCFSVDESVLPANVNQHVCIVRPNDKILSWFLKYFIESNSGQMQVELFQKGDREGLSAESIRNFRLPLPPLPEQQAIVAFLDAKTEKIDQYIAGKEKEIERLGELKQVEIANAVTHGLDPNAKMKPSGIAWIGDIPEEWEVKSLRHFLKLVSIKGFPEKPLLSVTREKGVIVRNLDESDENHNVIPEDLSGYKLVKEGQFVINKMKSWQGSYGVSDFDGIVSPAYFVCELNFHCKKYFNLAIRSKAYVPFFTQYSKGIRVDQWDLSPIALKSIPFIVPPLSEQQAIVAHIERKLERIDGLAEALRKEIGELKELKQRIVSDAVTGKCKVEVISYK